MIRAHLQKELTGVRKSQASELHGLELKAPHHGAPVAFCTLDRQGWILELNEAAGALLGPHPLVLSVAEGSRYLVWDHLRRCNQPDGRACTELKLTRRGTRELTVQLISIANPAPGGAGELHTAILDVSAKHRAQERLRTLALAAQKLGEAQDEPGALEAICAATVDSLADVSAAWLEESVNAAASIKGAHGGRVWVESQPRMGAAFWFALHAIESPAAIVLQVAAERRPEDRS